MDFVYSSRDIEQKKIIIVLNIIKVMDMTCVFIKKRKKKINLYFDFIDNIVVN